ncbi:chromate transporter [Pseudalkalibacillus caeni]|uniref:Chromate transporter n=1 Tax=Exobacillus caeni TaxID=2574798 RepID=A0A5R9F6J5_9BACL|nr:chromate transporter [Pseudalkalibacillus caeni]TLS38651.1 chromate transporter [Pseudalkalibacillus caeni]
MESRKEALEPTIKNRSPKLSLPQKQGQLFWAFFKVGMLGYGGGPSSIPLVHKEVVENYKWMNDDEFGDTLALANTLPGPIATKMAGYIGYKVGGITGLINAVAATIIPTIFLMVILLTSLSTFKDQQWVAGMAQAVVPVVGVMLAVLTWQFFSKAKGGLGWTGSIILVLASIMAIEFLGIHPGVVIFVLLVAAFIKKDKEAGNEKSGETS